MAENYKMLYFLVSVLPMAPSRYYHCLLHPVSWTSHADGSVCTAPQVSLTVHAETFSCPSLLRFFSDNASEQPAIITSTQRYHSCYCGGAGRRVQIDAILRGRGEKKPPPRIVRALILGAKQFNAWNLRQSVTHNCVSFQLWSSFGKPICTSMLFGRAFYLSERKCQT